MSKKPAITDSQRLDWLESQTSFAITRFNGDTIGMTTTESWKAPKLRDLIDDAIRASKKGER